MDVEAVHPLARHDGSQWDAPIGESVRVPDDIAARMRWRFYGFVGGLRVSGLCRAYKQRRFEIVLTDVLVDTSERAGALVHKPRITHHDRLGFLRAAFFFIPSTVIAPSPTLHVNGVRSAT